MLGCFHHLGQREKIKMEVNFFAQLITNLSICSFYLVPANLYLFGRQKKVEDHLQEFNLPLVMFFQYVHFSKLYSNKYQADVKKELSIYRQKLLLI